MSSIELVCLISVAVIQHDTTVEIKQRLRLMLILSASQQFS